MIELSLPLPNIVYQRTANQIDDRKGKIEWHKLTFYLREIDRQRDFYNINVKTKNKLYVIGIWDWGVHSETNLPPEFAFSSAPKRHNMTSDQVEMFKVVFENLVEPKERKRFVSIIEKIIECHGKQLKL